MEFDFGKTTYQRILKKIIRFAVSLPFTIDLYH